MDGGDGNDVISELWFPLDPGTDTIYGGNGIDIPYAGAGPDLVYAGIDETNTTRTSETEWTTTPVQTGLTSRRRSGQ